MRPLDSVNDPGFTQLIKTLEPRFDIESRTHITQTIIPQLYEETREKVMEKLKQAKPIALTTDGWTSRANRSFVTVTAHLIDPVTWKLDEYVLSTSEIVESHTAQNLAEHLKGKAKEWDIQLDKAVVTTDNASNIVLAMDRCNVLCHIRCMAHVLNLSSQKGLKVNAVSRLLGKVRSLVAFLHRSTLAANILRKTLHQLELPVLRPIIDVTTRWNSTYDMIERFLVLRPAVTAALSHKDLKHESYRDTISQDDMRNLGALKDVSIESIDMFIFIEHK